MIQQRNTARKSAAWIVSIGLALFFGLAGVTKLIGIPRQIALFDAIGIGQWFRYVTGILELTAAVLVLAPRGRALGIVMLVALSVGAIATLVFLGRPLTNGVAALAFSLLLAALRRSDFPDARALTAARPTTLRTVR